MSSPHDPYSANPYEAGSAFGDPPPKKRNWLLIILAVIGGLGVVCAVLCCGGGYWAFSASVDVISRSVEAGVADDPVIIEHIGEIESLDVNLVETSEVQDDEGKKTFAFDIVGDKGSGLLVARVTEGGDPIFVVESGRLLIDGETYELSP